MNTIPARVFAPLRSAKISPDLRPWFAQLGPDFEVEKRLTVSQWADKYRVFDKRTSAYPKFDSSLQPAMRAVQDACGDPVVRTVTVRGCRQCGKTTAPENALGAWISQEEDHGPVLWVEAIKENIRKPTFRARIDSLFKAETVREHAPTSADDRGSYKIVMPDMMVVFAWAGSQAAQSGDAMRYVILNEVGIYRKHTKLDSVSIAGKALTTWRERGATKLIETSTPEEEGDLLDREIKASDLRQYHLPCPHCGGYQILVFSEEHATAQTNAAGVSWSFADPHYQSSVEDVTADNVFFKCIHCGENFDERHRLDMLSKGVWARERGGLVAAAKAGATAPWPSGRADVYEPFTEHVGFHFPSFVSHWHPWWRTVQSFLKAVRSGDVEQLRNVVRFDFAEPWREKGEAPKASAVKRCIDSYHSRTVPAEAQVLGVFLGVDVQEISIYYVVRAFGPQWRSWLLDCGELAREFGKGSDLAPALDDLIGAAYRDELGDEVHAVEFAFIDAQYDTNAVYDYCIRNRGRIAPARGGNREFDPYIKLGKLEPGTKKRDGTTRRIPGEVVVHTINPWRFSEALVHSMRQLKDTPAEWRLPADIDQVDPRYLAQVTNQRRGRSASNVVVWKPIDSSTGDHYFDAEKMARAAAMLRHVDRRRPPGLKPPPRSAPVQPWLPKRKGKWLAR